MGKKILVLTVAVIISIFLVYGMVFATAPGKNVVFEVKGADKVAFDGKTHADKGLKCNDCHTKVFPMKKSAPGTYSMEKMNKGENCGICHNGKKAFSTSDKASCVKCHKKPS
ncbi:MAG: cytochrome c3 family protein [Nitrospirota bacterium]|jgi:c(7)-type cytochrome triheme protein